MNVVEKDKGALLQALKAGYPVTCLRLYGGYKGDEAAKLFCALGTCPTLKRFKERSLRNKAEQQKSSQKYSRTFAKQMQR